ncbi:hypothetical protein LSAT2_012553, partial [Lamellibrachia satsuma]
MGGVRLDGYVRVKARWSKTLTLPQHASAASEADEQIEPLRRTATVRVVATATYAKSGAVAQWF